MPKAKVRSNQAHAITVAGVVVVDAAVAVDIVEVVGAVRIRQPEILATSNAFFDKAQPNLIL